MNSSSQLIPPLQISLDNDDGDEQTPIILDETPDVSIDTVRFFNYFIVFYFKSFRLILCLRLRLLLPLHRKQQ
jgi:hypothetical protein